MIETYMSLFFASGLAIALLLVFRPVVLKHAGSRNAYLMWWAPVLAMSCSLIPVPDLFGAIVGTQKLASWRITASETIAEADVFRAPWLMTLILLPAVVRIAIEVIRYRTWLRWVDDASVGVEEGGRLPWADIRSCSLRFSPKVNGPVATGILRPRVFLPMDFESRYSRSQQRMVLAHEQVHIRRRDSVANALAFGLRWLFWFNPLGHLAYRRFRMDQELACDAAVLEGVGNRNRHEYADALVRSVRGDDHLTLAISLHPIRQQLEERLIMLTKFRSFPRKTRMACALALLITTSVVGSTSAFGTSNRAKDIAPSDVTVVHREAPRYPADAAKQGIEGHVTVEFRVLGDGSVDKIQVLDSQPPGVFDEVTVTAAAQWRFAERASPRQVTQTFEFALDE